MCHRTTCHRVGLCLPTWASIVYARSPRSDNNGASTQRGNKTRFEQRADAVDLLRPRALVFQTMRHEPGWLRAVIFEVNSVLFVLRVEQWTSLSFLSRPWTARFRMDKAMRGEGGRFVRASALGRREGGGQGRAPCSRRPR